MEGEMEWTLNFYRGWLASEIANKLFEFITAVGILHGVLWLYSDQPVERNTKNFPSLQANIFLGDLLGIRMNTRF